MKIRKCNMSIYLLCQLEKNIPGLSAITSVWVTDSASAVRVRDSFPLGDLLDPDADFTLV